MLTKALLGVGGLVVALAAVVWAYQGPATAGCCAVADPSCCPTGSCCASSSAAPVEAAPAESCGKDCCGACCTDEECYWCLVLGCDICCVPKCADQTPKGCCSK